MPKFVKSFHVSVTTDSEGVFQQADAVLVSGSTDDPVFSKVRTKILDPTPQNIAVLQALLDVRFAELKQEEGIE